MFHIFSILSSGCALLGQIVIVLIKTLLHSLIGVRVVVSLGVRVAKSITPLIYLDIGLRVLGFLV